MPRSSRRSTWTRIAAVVLFAAAMAYVESAVVAYLRTIFHITGELVTAAPKASQVWLSLPFFTLLKPGALGSVLPSSRIAVTEVGREVATIVMLGCVGWLTGREWRTRLAAFLLAFGVWDIGYYAFLKLLIGWPGSLRTLDVLFLIPGPWVAPAWLPMAISALMVAGGVWVLLQRR